MGSVSIPYDVVLKRHPKEVTEVVNRIQRGKSKDRNTDPATWAWTYQWSTWSLGHTFGDILSGKIAADRRAYETMTPEERVQDEVSRSRAYIQGRLPRTKAAVALSNFPPECSARIWEAHGREAAERARIDGLTPEQREAEFQETLDALRKRGGFFSVEVPTLAPTRR